MQQTIRVLGVLSILGEKASEHFLDEENAGLAVGVAERWRSLPRLQGGQVGRVLSINERAENKYWLRLLDTSRGNFRRSTNSVDCSVRTLLLPDQHLAALRGGRGRPGGKPLLSHLLCCLFLLLHLLFFLYKGYRWQKVQTLTSTPPLEVVARSKAVAKASPWDCCSAIVAREASRPEKGVIGGVGGGIARVRGEVVALGSPKA